MIGRLTERIASWIADKQVKHPSYFIGVFVFVSLMLFPGVFLLLGNVEPSLERVLPQGVAEVKTMNDMRSEFGADMMYVLVYAESPVFDVRNPELIRYIDVLSERLKLRENILRVRSLADIVKQDGRVLDSLPVIEARLNDSPFSSRFVNHDYSLSVIEIVSDTGSDAELISKVVRSIEDDIAFSESFNPGSYSEITGFNSIDRATFEVIISDFGMITVVSMFLIALVVFFVFRSFVKGMLPIAVVMVSLLWTMGVTGYLSLTLTVVSMVAAAMIMGLGIDFGIHFVHAFYEYRKNNSRDDALRETMKELLRAMSAAAFTTMTGFLALLFGVLPAMKTLGIILAMGIFNTLLGAVFLLPVLVLLYDKWAVNHTGKSGDDTDFGG